jgi:glucokinase
MLKVKNIVLGVDIGGSHITAGLVDMDKKKVIESSLVRNKVNRHGTEDEILNAWTATIQLLLQTKESEINKIGFAVPGPFDYQNGVCLIKGFDKYESLYGINIRNALAERLNFAADNILFKNDAAAFLEGEIFGGAAYGYNDVIGITLGTGLGSASSHAGITKDAEMSVLEYQGEKIEEWVSTRGIIRIYKVLTGKSVNDVLTIAELYDVDADARQCFRIFAEHLSWFLHKFIIQESPEILVIGGNIAQAYKLFEDNLLRSLNSSGIQIPKIIRASLGENALLIGGACNFLSIENNKINITAS